MDTAGPVLGINDLYPINLDVPGPNVTVCVKLTLPIRDQFLAPLAYAEAAVPSPSLSDFKGIRLIGEAGDYELRISL